MRRIGSLRLVISSNSSEWQLCLLLYIFYFSSSSLVGASIYSLSFIKAMRAFVGAIETSSESHVLKLSLSLVI